MDSGESALSLFHPLVQTWFKAKFEDPTSIQEQAWPVIAAGENILLTAPTGSGKTLTAFLWSLQKLLTEEAHAGLNYSDDMPVLTGETLGPRVVYISPMRALNNDIQANLLSPIAELTSIFNDAGEKKTFPTVAVRSGDTTSYERQKIYRHPPDIFITTPESLTILLCQSKGRRFLSFVETIIVDEIHYLFPDKRGTLLQCAIERLNKTTLAPKLQRIGISATIRPLDKVAYFLGGIESQSRGTLRPVKIVQDNTTKKKALHLEYPTADPGADSRWEAMVPSFLERIQKNRSTLIFAQSRRQTEKIARLVNKAAGTTLAYAHHGALSKTLRLDVEEKLRAGELKAIVATSTLEMGIDIGPLDEVLLVGTPQNAASTLQRIGRSGHRLADVSVGVFYPTYAKDLLNATVMRNLAESASLAERDYIKNPLDMLAQVILGMCLEDPVSVNEIYQDVIGMVPFAELPRDLFNRVIRLLAGRYQTKDGSELRPRLQFNERAGTVQATKGARLQLFLNGGAITDSGNFKLRVQDSNTELGELDEEYVWERVLGDRMNIGNRDWRITNITDNEVRVVPDPGITAENPFWRAEAANRDLHFTSAVAKFLRQADGCAERSDQELLAVLGDHLPEIEPREALFELLIKQRKATGCSLPHEDHVVFEYVNDSHDPEKSSQLIIHTFWSMSLNRPWALALTEAFSAGFGFEARIFPGDDGISILLPGNTRPAELLAMVRPDNLHALIEAQLSETAFFAARFLNNASRFLLIPKTNLKRRMPRWLVRKKASKLQQISRGYENFPVTLEAMRSIKQDAFALEALSAKLQAIQSGDIKISEVTTRTPSPFAAELVRSEKDEYVYETEKSTGSSRGFDLSLFGSEVPTVSNEVLQEVMPALNRRADLIAYCRTLEPSDAEFEVGQFVWERVFLLKEDWLSLVEAIDLSKDSETKATSNLFFLHTENATFVVHGHRLAQIHRALWTIAENKDENLADLLEHYGTIKSSNEVATDWSEIKGTYDDTAEEESGLFLDELFLTWFRFLGPVSYHRAAVFPTPPGYFQPMLDELVSRQAVAAGVLITDATERLYCHSETYEYLLRKQRNANQFTQETLPLKCLPFFRAHWHDLFEQKSDIQTVLDRLLLFPARPSLWEEEILPLRLSYYQPATLDALFAQFPVQWLFREKKLYLGFSDELKGLPLSPDEALELPDELNLAWQSFPVPFDLSIWQTQSGLDRKKLWQAAWQLAQRGFLNTGHFFDIRRAAESNFKLPKNAGSDHPAGAVMNLRARRRWVRSADSFGDWRKVPWSDWQLKAQSIDYENQIERWIDILLERYGIVSFELLKNELKPLQWSAIRRTLQRLELGGAIIGGFFFDGLDGYQYAHPKILQLWSQLTRLYEAEKKDNPDEYLFWYNAMDPISLCGLLPKKEKQNILPSRLASNYVIHWGAEILIVVKKRGRDLWIHTENTKQVTAGLTAFCRSQTEKEFATKRRLLVETINGKPALGSVWESCMLDCGFYRSYRGLEYSAL